MAKSVYSIVMYAKECVKCCNLLMVIHIKDGRKLISDSLATKGDLIP